MDEREQDLRTLIEHAEAGVADAMAVFETAESSYVAAATASTPPDPPIQTTNSTFIR